MPLSLLVQLNENYKSHGVCTAVYINSNYRYGMNIIEIENGRFLRSEVNRFRGGGLESEG